MTGDNSPSHHDMKQLAILSLLLLIGIMFGGCSSQNYAQKRRAAYLKIKAQPQATFGTGCNRNKAW